MKVGRLLYLGFAFPPGISGRFPELQPAGHAIETSLIESIRPHFDIRSVGISGLNQARLPRPSGAQNPIGVRPPGPPSPGLPHALNLLDKAPEIFHRYRSLRRLKAAYRSWQQAGWTPDVILVCNLSPVYDAFLRWLRPCPGQWREGSVSHPGSAPAQRPLKPPSGGPALILYLADSTTLGAEVPWRKKLRARFKPLVYPEAEMLPYFDACVAVSRTTEKLFAPRGIPWLWLPNGCDPGRARSPATGPTSGPIQFGYFGALGPHTGLPALIKIFTAREHAHTLHICGFGKAKAEIEAAAQKDARLRFYGPRTPDECLDLALNWDLLVNPRPLWPGNNNNFSSKVFEYALAGRAILTSRVSGVDLVLGKEGYYFDEGDFEASLDAALRRLAETSRSELQRRGAATQQRLLTEYSWLQQGSRLGEFLLDCLAGEPASALAEL